jgi:hypothetical protein
MVSVLRAGQVSSLITGAAASPGRTQRRREAITHKETPGAVLSWPGLRRITCSAHITRSHRPRLSSLTNLPKPWTSSRCQLPPLSPQPRSSHSDLVPSLAVAVIISRRISMAVCFAVGARGPTRQTSHPAFLCAIATANVRDKLSRGRSSAAPAFSLAHPTPSPALPAGEGE